MAQRKIYIPEELLIIMIITGLICPSSLFKLTDIRTRSKTISTSISPEATNKVNPKFAGKVRSEAACRQSQISRAAVTKTETVTPSRTWDFRPTCHQTLKKFWEARPVACLIKTWRQIQRGNSSKSKIRRCLAERSCKRSRASNWWSLWIKNLWSWMIEK